MKRFSPPSLAVAAALVLLGLHTGFAGIEMLKLRARREEQLAANARVDRVIHARAQRQEWADEIARAHQNQPYSSASSLSISGESNLGVIDAALSTDPAYRANLSLQYRQQAEKFWGPVLPDLQLAPSEHETFFSLLVERNLVPLDLEILGRQGGMSLESAEQQEALADTRAQLQNDVDLRIKQLLGPARAERWSEYRRLAPAWQQLRFISDRLECASAALSETQSARLLQLLLQALRNDATLAHMDSPVPDAVLRQGENFLSPAQLHAIEKLRLEQNAQQQVTQIVADLSRS